MKIYRLIWLALLVATFSGCATSVAPKKAARLKVVLPPTKSLIWKAGESTEDCVFVVVSSKSLAVPMAQWPVWAITTQTNLPFVLNDSPRFFALYTSNTVTGEIAWSIK